MKKKLKILAMFDIPHLPEEEGNFSFFLNSTDWKDERNVIKSLRVSGHEVIPFGIYDDIFPLINSVKIEKPDLVFNMCESFNDQRDLEPNLIALLELLGVSYTGASSESLSLCKDKGLTKKILSYHNINVPGFVIIPKGKSLRELSNLNMPCIVKPLTMDASEGISENSRVSSLEACREKVEYIHKKYKTDVIVEEYIEGRELYIGVLGNQKVSVFKPMELFFRKVPKNKPKFLTYNGKWNQNYRKKWGIDSDPAKYLDPKILKKIQSMCKNVYNIFGLQGYARIDLRLKEDGSIYFLEVNPNPSIARIDDFAQAAKLSGIPYDELINKIVNLASHPKAS